MRRNKALLGVIAIAVVLCLVFGGCNKENNNKPSEGNDNTPVIVKPKDEEKLTATMFLTGIGSVWELTEDVQEDIGSLKITRAKTIDLNGHNLTLTGEYLIGSYTLTIKDSAEGTDNKVDLSGLRVEKAERNSLEQNGQDFFIVFILVAKSSNQVAGIEQMPNSAERYTEKFASVIPENNSSVSYTYEYLTPQSYALQSSGVLADYLSSIHTSGEAYTISADTDADLVEITIIGDVTLEVAGEMTLRLSGDIIFEGGSLNIILDKNSHLDITGISPEVFAFNPDLIGKTYISITYDSLLGDQAIRLAEYDGWDLVDDGTAIHFKANADYTQE